MNERPLRQKNQLLGEKYLNIINLIDIIYNRLMLAQIPRTPIFPEHSINLNDIVILKEMKRIQKDVEDDVIPVSAGIYSEHKLVERLQAIPKPDTVDYQDRYICANLAIFFETIDVASFPCKNTSCPLCGEQYGNKKNIPIQCNFCGVWNCQNCMCPRKRYHPRAKESSSERFSICYKCDDKFLSLTLNHGFVESKALLEEVMRRARKQKDEFELQCDKRQTDSNYARDTANKNIFKISSIKKEQVDFKKTIAKLQAQRQEQTMKLRVRQKYLSILLKKKDSVRRKNEQRLSLQLNQQKGSTVISKAIRSLSHTNVYSESIKIEVIGQQQQKQSIKDTNYSRTEENTYSPPLQRAFEQIKQEKVNNFYNYNEWVSQQKGEVFEVDLNSPEKTYANTQKVEVQSEIKKQNKPESLAQQKIAQIFSKPETVTQQQDYSSQDEAESLDGQVIKIRKAELMRAAIQNSHKSRIETMDTEMYEPGPKKCTCQLY